LDNDKSQASKETFTENGQKVKEIFVYKFISKQTRMLECQFKPARSSEC
jgi:hypothetical protein